MINKSVHPLLVGDMLSINGYYGVGCTARFGNAWSVGVAEGAMLAYSPLSVVKNDTDCVLTLVEVVTTAGTIPTESDIPLDDEYQMTASPFANFEGPTLFYANAKLSSVTFASDFVITLLISDDPALASGSKDANWAVQQATAEAGLADAPDYTLDMTDLTVQTDNNNIVQSAGGHVDMIAGNISGQHYVVLTALAKAGDTPTYAEIHTAYGNGVEQEMSSTIAAASFLLTEVDLTLHATRYLIVSNTQDGVPSYQLFTITFNHVAL